VFCCFMLYFIYGRRHGRRQKMDTLEDRVLDLQPLDSSQTQVSMREIYMERSTTRGSTQVTKKLAYQRPEEDETLGADGNKQSDTRLKDATILNTLDGKLK